MAYVVIEICFHLHFEVLETAVGVDMDVIVWNEVHRTYLVVKIDGVEIWVGWTPIVIDIVYLHRFVQVDFAGKFFF